MASKTYFFTGKCQWARIYKDQIDIKFQQFSLDLCLDKAMEKLYKESGIQTHIQVSGEHSQTGRELTWYDGEKGVKFVRLKRKTSQLIRGQHVDFGPPIVLDKDNKPFDKPVGNGSTITCKVIVFDTVKGKGSRLESVRVDEWVEYEGANKPEEVNVPKLPF